MTAIGVPDGSAPVDLVGSDFFVEPISVPVEFVGNDIYGKGVWSIKNKEGDNRACVTGIRTRPNARGCGLCRTELWLPNDATAPLPLDWLSGPGENDGLWPVLYESWRILATGSCDCSGPCLDIEAVGFPIEPYVKIGQDKGECVAWREKCEEGTLLGRTVTYYAGRVCFSSARLPAPVGKPS